MDDVFNKNVAKQPTAVHKNHDETSNGGISEMYFHIRRLTHFMGS